MAAEPVELVRGVSFVPGSFVPGLQPDGNSIVFQTSGGSVVIDTGRHAEHTKAVMKTAEASGAPPAAIVNTHWHLDHVSGNALFRAAHPDIPVYGTRAIEDARIGFLANYRKQLEDVIANSGDEDAKRRFEAEIARIDAGDALMPSEIVESSRVIEIGDRRLELHVTEHSVTAADIWVFDPVSKILVAGDLVTLPVPFLDTACPEGWRMALEALAATDFDVLVPGHGAPMGREQFDRYRRAFGNLLSCARGDGSADSCVEGWMNDASPLLTGDRDSTRGMLDYYVGLLRSERAAANCPAE